MSPCKATQNTKKYTYKSYKFQSKNLDYNEKLPQNYPNIKYKNYLTLEKRLNIKISVSTRTDMGNAKIVKRINK